MNKVNTESRCSSAGRNEANTGRTSGAHDDLELGRMAVTLPHPGRLDVYDKYNGSRGTAFISYRDGGRYGVTRGVMESFAGLGSYEGWGYPNHSRTAIFRFVAGDLARMPESLVVILTAEGDVGLPPSLRVQGEHPDGTFVAFYARPVKNGKAGQTRWVATDIFPIDGDHLLLVARLIGSGRLTFPDHNQVVRLFLDGLSGSREFDRSDQNLLESALAYLATNSNVPAEFQTLARVERTRLSWAAADPIPSVITPHPPTSASRGHNARNGERKTTGSGCRKAGVVVDVTRLALRLDKE